MSTRWHQCAGAAAALWVLLGGGASPARAQGTSAAAITGVVKDSSGAVIPGATVEASSPALIENVRSAVTDDKGQYQIIELVPGTYRVTFSLSGFSTLTKSSI